MERFATLGARRCVRFNNQPIVICSQVQRDVDTLLLHCHVRVLTRRNRNVIDVRLAGSQILFDRPSLDKRGGGRTWRPCRHARARFRGQPAQDASTAERYDTMANAHAGVPIGRHGDGRIARHAE